MKRNINKEKNLTLSLNSAYEKAKPTKKYSLLLRFIFVAILSFCTVLMFESYIHTDALNLFVLGLLSLLFTLLFTSFKSKKLTLKIFCAVAIGLFIILFSVNYTLVFDGFVNIINKYLIVTVESDSSIKSLSDYEQSVQYAYALILMIINLGLCSSLYYTSSFKGTFFITFPFFELGAYWGLVPNYVAFFVMLFSWAISMGMSNTVQSKIRKKSDFSYNSKTNSFEVSSKTVKNDNSNHAFVYTFALCCGVTVITLLASVIFGNRPESVDQARYEIKMAIENFNVKDVPQYIENITESMTYSSNKKIGATNSGKLGRSDKITFSNKTVLKIEIESVRSDSSANQDTPLYLKGFVGSYYTGNSWEEYDTGSYLNEYILDSGENDFNYQNYGSFILENAVDDRTLSKMESIITIKNVGANTKYLYTPYYANFQTIDYKEIYKDFYIIPKSKEYTYNYYTGLSSDSMLKKYSAFSTYNYYALANYQEFVFDNYLDYDFEVIQSAYRYLFSNYESEINRFFEVDDYDELTKAQIAANLIKKYFEENFTYSLDVGKTPSDKDFVQYFLEEQKSGSCTYFASAGTLLMRAMGIPARYVEGFMVENSQFSKVDDKTIKANVKDKDGHAWCEIFISDIGWVPVEFTVGYENGQNPNYTATTTSATYSVQSQTKTETTTTTTTEKITSSTKSPNGGVDTKNTVTSISKNNTSSGNKADYSKIIVTTVQIVLIITFVLCVLFIWKTVYNRRRKAILNLLNNTDRRIAVKTMYDELCKIFKIVGITFEKSKTDIQNSDKIYDMLSKIGVSIDKEKFGLFVELAVESDMSRNTFSEESFDFANEVFELITSQLWNNLTPIRKFKAKYIKFLY